MSKVLKMDLARLRRLYPERYQSSRRVLPEGKGVRMDVSAGVMSPKARHELAWRKD